jgi:hypothetical protein
MWWCCIRMDWPTTWPRARDWRCGGDSTPEKALVVLHFALEAPEDDAELRAVLLDAVGGRFEAGWSVNPTWTVRTPAWPRHPVTRGMAAFEVEDEWYYHLRFATAAPGCSPSCPCFRRQTAWAMTVRVPAIPPSAPRWPKANRRSSRGTAQTPHGARGFGFTGGHFHRNWYQPAFRRLVTNGIVWAANLEVPESGVTSTASAAPVYPTIDESIARGDVADVARHLDADPTQINGRPEAKMRPLHQAILRRKVPVIELLLARGADPRLPRSRAAFAAANGGGAYRCSGGATAVESRGRPQGEGQGQAGRRCTMRGRRINWPSPDSCSMAGLIPIRRASSGAPRCTRRRWGEVWS